MVGQSPGAMLSHSVYFALDDNSDAAVASLVADCKEYLSGHPGTVFFAAGTLAEEFNREVNVRDFDVVLLLVFKDRAGPRHLSGLAAPRAVSRQAERATGRRSGCLTPMWRLGVRDWGLGINARRLRWRPLTIPLTTRDPMNTRREFPAELCRRRLRWLSGRRRPGRRSGARSRAPFGSAPRCSTRRRTPRAGPGPSQARLSGRLLPGRVAGRQGPHPRHGRGVRQARRGDRRGRPLVQPAGRRPGQTRPPT